jgi:hypothetical protein
MKAQIKPFLTFVVMLIAANAVLELISALTGFNADGIVYSPMNTTGLLKMVPKVSALSTN